MNTSATSDSFLRRALRVDAIGCGLFAAAVAFVLLGPNSLMTQLDVPKGMLIAVGVVALYGVPRLWSISKHRKISRVNAWTVVGANAAWAVMSCVAVFVGWIQPSTLGVILIVTQGILTGVVAELEFIGLRRAGVAT